MGAIYVPQDTRMGDISNTLMNIVQLQNIRKKQQRDDAAIQLSTLMELGGSPDENTLSSISKNLGINPTLLTSIMKDGKFPSAAERRIAETGGAVKATAQANKEVAPIVGETEAIKRGAMRPVLKGEKQDEADIQFDLKQRELDKQFEMEKKKSKEITIPEFKQTHDYLLSNEKDLLSQKLTNEKELKKYERTIQTTNPTPKETAEINSLQAHAKYYEAAAKYQSDVRSLIAGSNKANKDYLNDLKQHTQFMKDNQSLFYGKEKGGKITPKEYEIGSQQEIDFKELLKNAGIKYEIKTIPGSKFLGVGFSDKHAFVPVAPDMPKQSVLDNTGIDIKSFTKSNVTLSNGKTIMRNPDGTVTINGQIYQVSEE